MPASTDCSPDASAGFFHRLPSKTFAAVPGPWAAVPACPRALSFEMIWRGCSLGRPFLAAVARAAASASRFLLIAACCALTDATLASFCRLISACRARSAAASTSRRRLISACWARAAAAGSLRGCEGGVADRVAGAALRGAGAGRAAAAGDWVDPAAGAGPGRAGAGAGFAGGSAANTE